LGFAAAREAFVAIAIGVIHEMSRAKIPLGFGDAGGLLFAVADEAVAPLSAIGPKSVEPVQPTPLSHASAERREFVTGNANGAVVVWGSRSAE
jgi:hypothetical protein